MSDANPNISRRVLIGGLAGVLVLGGGAGVAAGLMGKDNAVQPEVAQPTTEPSVAPTKKPVEIEVPAVDELEKKVAEPAPAAPAPEVVPINPADIPEHDTIPQEQIDKENADREALNLDTSNVKPVGE